MTEERRYLEYVRTYIEDLATHYRYRPLPQVIREHAIQTYLSGLNGFDDFCRQLRIRGHLVATGYTRVVVGDYGAYVEIAPEDLVVQLQLQPGQEWRANTAYVTSRQLSIKYLWYHFRGVKVYFQLAGVKYADYQPGYYYIAVLDFD